MSQSRRRWFAAAVTAALLCAAAAAVCLSLALVHDYDAALGHFRAGSATALAAAILCVVGCLFGIPAAVAADKAGCAALTPTNELTVSSGFTRTLAVGFAGKVRVSSILVGLLFILTFLFTVIRTGLPESNLERIRLVLMALSAGYFLLLPSQKKEKPLSFMILSLVPILYAILSVLVIYFSTDTAMNAPMKIYGIMLHLALGLYFTCEARYALDRVKPRYFALLGVWAAVLAITVGGAGLFAASRGILPGSVLENAAVLALGLFADARAFCLGAVEATEEDSTPEFVPASQEESHEAESD